jgi:hypothetical protein
MKNNAVFSQDSWDIIKLIEDKLVYLFFSIII